MSLNSMAQRLILEVPGIPAAHAKNLINEALNFIYDGQMWSFQLKESGFLTPGLLFPNGSLGNSTGRITATSFQPTVIADSVASAAWLPYLNSLTNRPLFTELQIRSPYYSLYNIISVNKTNPAAIILTLDRPWMEPGGSQTYMIYQAYFPVPVPDFKRFLTTRDTTNNSPIDYWTKNESDLAMEDAQRTIFNDPLYFVPYETDQRVGSATLGNMMYEMWPHPLSILPYTFSYLRRGPTLQRPNDTVPAPLTEECVLHRTKEVAYLWKEAQKGEDMERGAGADWKYLAEASHDQYKLTLKPIKDRDRDLCELYWNKFNPDYYNGGEGYATESGGLNVGRM